jgi:hypothetical protein
MFDADMKSDLEGTDNTGGRINRVRPSSRLPEGPNVQTSLKVEPRPNQSFKIDRRTSERVRRTGAAMAAFFDEDGALSLTRVELVDVSEGGMGLVCPVDVEPGVRFSLYWGTSHPHSTGVVVRCSPEGEDFRVGLRCDGRLAA